MDTRHGRVRWGVGEDRIRTGASNWALPLRWDRKAAAAGKMAAVFCLSLGDIWDNEVDPAWRREAFDVMHRTPNLLYLLLSKRIGNAKKMCDPLAGNPCLPNNAALGATMASQDEWDRDVPKLIETGRDLGARFTFASVEPMLGAINAKGQLPDWVIVGGESGQHARPMHPDWARSLRDQCAAASVPFFFKQWGEWREPVGEEDYDTSRGRAGKPPAFIISKDGTVHCFQHLGDDARPVVIRVGKKAAGNRLDGREHKEFPTALTA